MANPPRPVPTNLEVPPGMETIYANLARISHSPADIVMDFAHALPGENKAVIKARVLMSPLSAKLFYRALGDNIARFEAAFGEITIPSNTSLAEHLFRPHQPPEPPADKKE
ncbi:MAG: hypothetical protein A3K45_05280 [Chloroflexi bacterium RIFOXYC12_FULL_59_14]|nr:MAG: hypothetical protein A3K45_05280 [Chloroflexi bacterium RIFOXYC12_FULL_59_14]